MLLLQKTRITVNYLLAESISKSYGERILFENLTFGIDQGQKIALISRNGTGKSTILDILAGLDEPDSGSIVTRNDIRIGYLSQNPLLNDELTAMEACFGSESKVAVAIGEYELCLEHFADDPSPENQRKLEDSISVMDLLEAWDFEVKVKQILFQLDITHLDQKVKELSGGQRKRLALSKVLIENPELLILDEPTNHLDTNMIEWLEEFLSRQNLTLLVVTHDRYFLDNVCNDIIELDNRKLYRYKGNYAYFLEKKAEREANEEREHEKLQSNLKSELEWMRRMPQARTTKSKARIDAFYELKDKASRYTEKDKMKLDLKMTYMGKKILEIENISKKYGDIVLLENFNYIFHRNEKIGIVGKNGSGKSTLLNILAGLLRADSGRVVTGETIELGYFTQDGIKLNEDKRVIDVVKEIAEEIPMSKGTSVTASQFLNYFMFPPAVQYNFVSTLSGGEKRRLYLLTVLVKNPNFLILDEPTNDLDIATLNVLEEFLENFPGCVIVVSHDRYFLDRIADHMFVFRGNGEIKDHYGTYSEYRIAERKFLSSQKPERKEKKQETVANTNQENAGKRKLSYKEQKEFEQLENDLALLEKEKEELHDKLNFGNTDHEQLLQWSERLGEIISLIDHKTDRWLELSDV